MGEMEVIKTTNGKCRVCGGGVVEKFKEEKAEFSAHDIIGPGFGKKEQVVSSGLHCSVCGIKYAFIPK